MAVVPSRGFIEKTKTCVSAGVGRDGGYYGVGGGVSDCYGDKGVEDTINLASMGCP